MTLAVNLALLNFFYFPPQKKVFWNITSRTQTTEFALRSSTWIEKVTVSEQPGWRQTEHYKEITAVQEFWTISTKKTSRVSEKKNQDETTLHRRPGKPPHIKKWTNSFAHKVKLKEDDRQQTKDRMEMCLKRDNETSRVQVTEFCNFSTQLGQRCFSLEEKLQRKTFLVSARLFSAPVPVRYKWKMYLFKDCTLAGENWGWNW